MGVGFLANPQSAIKNQQSKIPNKPIRSAFVFIE
jgi:hypothetical protein